MQARRIGFFWLSLAQGSPLLRKNIASARSTVGARFPEKSHRLRVEVYVPLLTALRFRDEKRARRRIEIGYAQSAQFSIPSSRVQASSNNPLKVLLFCARHHKCPLILLAEENRPRDLDVLKFYTRLRVQQGSKTWPFCVDFGSLIGIRATESMGLRV